MVTYFYEQQSNERKILARRYYKGSESLFYYRQAVMLKGTLYRVNSSLIDVDNNECWVELIKLSE